MPKTICEMSQPNQENNDDRSHFEFEEINVERKKTITFISNNKNIKSEKILAYLQGVNLIEKTECLQTIYKEEKTYYEITAKTFQNKEEIETQLNRKICIENEVLKQTDNRELKDIIKRPVISVIIYEAPYELADLHILNKLKQYGEVKGEIQRHRYRGTNILNGNRSLNFSKINLSIPTTLYVKGNRIRIKYDGQDRTAICSFCRERGHYKLVCQKYIKQQEEYENRIEIDEEQMGPNINMQNDEQIQEEEILSNQASKSWAQIVEKNEKRNTINQSVKPKNPDDLTQKLKEIESIATTQIRFKPNIKLTEEEKAERKKRRKIKKKENKDRRRREINSIREITHTTDSDNENTWSTLNDEPWDPPI